MDQVAMAMAKKMFFDILIFKKHLFSIFQNLVFDFLKKRFWRLGQGRIFLLFTLEFRLELELELELGLKLE